jgi:hypothetical protein
MGERKDKRQPACRQAGRKKTKGWGDGERGRWSKPVILRLLRGLKSRLTKKI